MAIDADSRMDSMQANLATLASQNEAMARDIAEIKTDLKSALKDHSVRLNLLEVGRATCDQRWSSHADAHKTENRTVTVISTIISSAIAAAIGIYNWFKGP